MGTRLIPISLLVFLCRPRLVVKDWVFCAKPSRNISAAVVPVIRVLRYQRRYNPSRETPLVQCAGWGVAGAMHRDGGFVDALPIRISDPRIYNYQRAMASLWRYVATSISLAASN
jgi:hypothetical protein